MLRIDGELFGGASRLHRRPKGRGRDRRVSLSALVGSLAQYLSVPDPESSLVQTLEHGLTSLLGLRASRVRERPEILVELPSVPDSERALVDIPTPKGRPQMMLEARVPAGMYLDDWDRQVLASAAHLASLVLEIERRRVMGGGHGASASRPALGAPPALVGSSDVMRLVREHIQRVAATDFTVLIQGESGTGKELVARQIHELSSRRSGPFIAVNCAAIVDSLLEAELFGIEDRTATGVRGRRGKFEHAEGGTLFLDEVSDLAPAAQAKLLRAIQELTVERVGGHLSRKINTRIVVATNRSLKDLSVRGLFREDLYYRLSGVELRVPPLRLRTEDISELVQHFLGRSSAAQTLGLSPEAAEAMRVYDWPGNVRELERMVEGAVTMARGPVITIDDLPSALRHGGAEALLPALAQNETMRACGARYARIVLEKCNQNKRKACRTLDISYHTLQAYLRWPGRAGDGAAEPIGDGAAEEWEEMGVPRGVVAAQASEAATDGVCG